MLQMSSAFLRDFTQYRIVVYSEVSGQPFGHILKGQTARLTLEDGSDTLSLNVGKKLPFSVA